MRGRAAGARGRPDLTCIPAGQGWTAAPPAGKVPLWSREVVCGAGGGGGVGGLLMRGSGRPLGGECAPASVGGVGGDGDQATREVRGARDGNCCR